MIQDILPRYQEVANGSKTVFTFPFDVLRNEFIEVYVDSAKVTSGWTLSASNKTVTFGVAPVAGKVITIYRNIPVEWVTNLGTASSASIGEAITYLVAQIQTIKEGLSRAIQTRIIDTDKGEDISDDYINSLGQATSLYGQCELLLSQIQSEGADIEALYLEFLGRMNNLISTDTNLGNSDTVVPSQKAVKTYVDNGLNDKADDSNVVHLSGNETINGDKLFKGQAQFTAGIGISFKTSADDEYYVMRSSGAPSAGCGLFLNNSVSTAAFNVSTDKITIGSGNILPNSVTPATSDSSTRIATTAYVKSNLSNYVSLEGNETIGGTKTFVVDPYIKNPTPQLYISDTTQTKGTAPSADVWGGITFHDANGNLMGRCRQLYNSSKKNTVALQVYKANSSSDTASASLGISYPASGDPYTSAPTPTVSDNSTKIATTAYINTKFKKVSTLPASPNANTFYFIPE